MPEKFNLELIRESIKSVPAMKYALALIALLSIVSSIPFTGISFTTAAIGVIGILILMVMIVIFTAVARLRGPIKKPAIILVWFSLIIMILSVTLVFTSVFFNEPLQIKEWILKQSRNKSIEFLKEVRDQIKILRGNWEDESNPEKPGLLTKIKEQAEALAGIADSDLNLGYQIEKYHFIAYAYVMVADLEKDRERSDKYANTAIENAQQALGKIAEAEKRRIEGDYFKDVCHWIIDDNQKDRMNHQVAMSYSILHRNGNLEAKQKGLDVIKKISSDFQIAHAYFNNSVLKPLFETNKPQ